MKYEPSQKLTPIGRSPSGEAQMITLFSPRSTRERLAAQLTTGVQRRVTQPVQIDFCRTGSLSE